MPESAMVGLRRFVAILEHDSTARFDERLFSAPFNYDMLQVISGLSMQFYLMMVAM